MSEDVLDLIAHSEPSRVGLRDRMLRLRSVENFAGVDEDALTRLAEHARPRRYKKGDVITLGGAPPESIHIVVEGQVSLIRKKSVETMAVGGGFNILSAIANAPTRRAVADVDTRTLEIPVTALRVAMEENFSLLRHALRMMGRTIIGARGSLPGDPARPPSVDPGVYYERPKTLAERLVGLRQGPFEAMNFDALVDLSRRAVECRYPAGHVFWSVEDPSSFWFEVDYGRVRCTAGDGSEMVVGRNFTLGVMDVWASQPRSYEARAETAVIGYHVAYEDFSLILEMHPEVGLELLRNLATRMLERD